jgi:plasmid stabilization system protein ParE
MKKTYSMVITKSAENDIFDIHDFIKLDKIGAANKWRESVKKQILSLKNNPYRCPEIPENEKLNFNFRYLIHGNYRMIYKITKNEIIVLRVIHGARLLNQNYFI